MRAVQRSASLAIVTALVAFASCREPTQITVRVTTDAACPAGDDRPRLNDIVILTGKEIVVGQPGAPQPAPAVNAETDLCKADSGTNLVGTLVLLPGDGDSRTVEVLIAAGVQRDATDDENSATAGGCASDVFNGSSIEGKPCIIARRRLTFIDHNSLVLPIDLDRRCIGEDCGADLTCYQGNCVDPSVDCTEDAAECAPPEGCPDECENDCGTGVAECVKGVCGCLTCKNAECAGSDLCGPGFVGLCVDAECGCVAGCPEGCEEDGGICEGPECVFPTCTPEDCSGACGVGGMRQCIDIDGILSCVCVGDCDEPTCVTGEDCPDGQLGECGRIEGEEACICACNDGECAADCDTMCGQCNDLGACACSAPCDTAGCTNCDTGQVSTCEDFCGGCQCLCQPDKCTTDCLAMGFTEGACESGSETCNCTTSSTTTVSGTTVSAGGFGGMSGGGGFPVTNSAGGFGGMGGDGFGGFPVTNSAGGMGGMGGGCLPIQCMQMCAPDIGMCTAKGCECTTTISGGGGGGQALCPQVLVPTCAQCETACNSANPMCHQEICSMPASGGFANCQCSMP